MHILYISNLFPPRIVGGAELFAGTLAQYVAEAGADVTVITLGHPNGQSLPFPGVRLIHVTPWNIYDPYDGRDRSVLRRVAFHLWDSLNLHAFKRVLALFRILKPDIVHTHNLPGFGELVWLAAKRLGTPVVHTAHDFHLLCPRTTLLRSNGSLCTYPALACKVWRRWHFSMSRWVDWFVSPSKFLLKKHLDAGLKARNTVVIPNGISCISPKLQRSQKPLDEPVRFLFLGQLARHKGPIEVVESFKKILGKDRTNAELHIAGKGPLEEIVRQHAAAEERIKFHGFVAGEAKDQLLREADVLVLPSKWYENAPISVLEAYNYGLPVIASRIGGIPELVHDGTTGILVTPGNVEELGEALRQLAGDRIVLAKMRNAALREAQALKISNTIKAYMVLYRQVLAEGTVDL